MVSKSSQWVTSRRKCRKTHLDGVEPGAIGGKVEQDESACRSLHHRIHFLIFMGIGIVPGHVNRFRWMFFHQRGKQLCNLLTPFVRLKLNKRFACVIVDSSNAIVSCLLTGCWDHHLLPFGAPHRSQGRKPTDVELIGIIKDFPCFDLISGLFNQLLFDSIIRIRAAYLVLRLTEDNFSLGQQATNGFVGDNDLRLLGQKIG